MSISFDDQLETIDRHIERQKLFVKDKSTQYHASYIAKIRNEIEVFQVVRETVRQARQNQQMTTMSGKRIEDT